MRCTHSAKSVALRMISLDFSSGGQFRFTKTTILFIFNDADNNTLCLCFPVFGFVLFCFVLFYFVMSIIFFTTHLTIVTY